MFEDYMSLSIMGRAAKKGALQFQAHDLRDWTHDRLGSRELCLGEQVRAHLGRADNRLLAAPRANLAA